MRGTTIQKTNVRVFETHAGIAHYLVDQLRSIEERAIQDKGYCAIALSGGRTPAHIYDEMAKEMASVGDIHIFLVDERFVPYDDPRSNYRMIKEHLSNSAPGMRLHPVPIEESLQMSCTLYDHGIRSFFHLLPHQLPRFDMVLLGIGEDGHTASLFPHDPDDKDQSIVKTSFGGGTDRVTLTLESINNARSVFFLVTGIEKADVVKNVIERRNSDLPAAKVQPVEGDPVFLLDVSSASRLSKKHRGNI